MEYPFENLLYQKCELVNDFIEAFGPFLNGLESKSQEEASKALEQVEIQIQLMQTETNKRLMHILALQDDMAKVSAKPVPSKEVVGNSAEIRESISRRREFEAKLSELGDLDQLEKDSRAVYQKLNRISKNKVLV